jgi:hypothetical protein
MCFHLQDIASRISSFSLGPLGVHILSATGVLSSVVIHQPGPFGGTMKYDVLLNLLLSFLFPSFFFFFFWTSWMASIFGFHAFHKHILPFCFTSFIDNILYGSLFFIVSNLMVAYFSCQ